MDSFLMDWRTGGRNPFSYAALAEAWKRLGYDGRAAEAAEQACRLAGVRPLVAVRTQSVEAARSLIATGAGVAILPDLAYRPWSLEGDRIEARDLTEAIPPVEVAVAWRRGAARRPRSNDCCQSSSRPRDA